jgi:D,D-heptose 1,7-bisphosphate phosphatase
MHDLVILAGGKGSRIKKYLNGRPKPLIKILGYNFLDYILFLSSKFFFQNIFIVAGYRGSLIRSKYHLKHINLSLIRVINEKKLKGTGGALFEVKKFIKNDFFLVNGDSIFDINFFDLIKNLKQSAVGKIALTKNTSYTNNSKLNHLCLSKTGQLHYSSKVKSSFLMNGGVYFFKNSFLKNIKNKYSSLELDILPDLIKKGKIYGKFYKNFFLDIGTEKNLKLAPKKFNFFFKPAIFIDRDGVINYDNGYTHKIKELRLIKETIQYLKKKKDYYFFIVTNQAGIAKKKFSIQQFFSFQSNLSRELYKRGIFINDTKFCPHHTQALLKKFKKKCSCRKPNNKMLEDLLKTWPVIRKKSFMIGDSISDRIAATKTKIAFKSISDIISSK